MKKALKYIGLFMFGVIAFPILLFLNWKNKDKDYKNYLIASGVGFAFFLIGGIFEEDTETDTSTTGNTEQVEEEPAEVPEQEEEVEEEPQEEPAEEVPEETTEDRVESYAKEVFGDDLTDFEYQSDSNHYNITTKTAGISKKIDKNSANVNTTEFLEKIDGEDFDTIYIEYQADFVDDYGESSKGRAIVYHISKETVEKINFDNFVFDNLPKVADNYWEHPALR